MKTYLALVTLQSLLAIKAVSGMFLKRQSPTDASIAAGAGLGGSPSGGLADYAGMYGGLPLDSGLYANAAPDYGNWGGGYGYPYNGYGNPYTPTYTVANSGNQAGSGSVAAQRSNNIAANIQASKNDAFTQNNNGASIGSTYGQMQKRQYGPLYGPPMPPSPYYGGFPGGIGYGNGYGSYGPGTFSTGQMQNAGMGQEAYQHASTLGANINQSDNNAYYKSDTNQNAGNSQATGAML